MGMLILCFIIAYLIVIRPRYIMYKDSTYIAASGNSFINTIFNKGSYGEFLTYYKLEKLSGYNKLLTNLYIPKEDGSTTEIDLVMMSKTGIYVFESKNYSGWIFGSESQRNWTQTFPNNKKFRFYNPIWQNNGHINALKYILGVYDTRLYKSYIIFSERCTLKKINLVSKNVRVIKRNDLLNCMEIDLMGSENLLSVGQIDNIYEKLGKYSLADEKVKQEHINNV